MTSFEIKYDRPVPDIGELIAIGRPDSCAFLPAVYIDHDDNAPIARKDEITAKIAPGKMSWYSFSGGPTLVTLVSEYDYTPGKPKQHWVTAEKAYAKEPWQALVILSPKHPLKEYASIFEVVYSAPQHLVLEFNRLIDNDSKVPFAALIAASDWHHYGYVSVGVNCGGHNMVFNFNKNHGYELADAINQASELYDKLPSGSGFNNNWHISFLGEWVEAVTSYDAMDEFGGYTDPIDLDYTLYRKDGKWEVDVDFFGDDIDEPEDYYEEVVWEALNHA